MSKSVSQSKPIIVLLKPDVFLRKILKPALSEILDGNIEIIDFKCDRLCDKQFYLMYSPSFSWGHDHWTHNKTCFEFGPVLALLLSSKEGAARLLERFNHKKGSALPFKRDSASIRYKLNSKSRIFNILHIPSTEKESDEQAEAWFGAKFNSAISKSNGFKSQEELFKEIESHGYLSDLNVDPEYTFIKAKVRLIHSLEKTLCCHSADQIGWKNLKNFYDCWVQEIESNKKNLGIEGTVLAYKHPEEIELWRSIQHQLNLQKIPSIKEIQLAELLTDLYAHPGKQNHSLGFFFEVLAIHRVFLTSLETYLIQSRFIYTQSL